MPSMLISSCVARPGMTSGFWRKALPHAWVLASFIGVRRRAGKRVNQPLKAEALRICRPRLAPDSVPNRTVSRPMLPHNA